MEGAARSVKTHLSPLSAVVTVGTLLDQMGELVLVCILCTLDVYMNWYYTHES